MLSFNHAETRSSQALPEFRRTWAVAALRLSHDQMDELRYFEGRIKQELELAAAATHPNAESIRLELARAYRARVRALRSPREVQSWLDEGGASLPSDSGDRLGLRYHITFGRRRRERVRTRTDQSRPRTNYGARYAHEYDE